MGLDNETARDEADFVHQCYRDRTVSINPIIDWTENDVWNFLHHYGCEGNPLYQCGESRVGCVGCPLAGYSAQRKELSKYPKYRINYVRAFGRMLKARKESGLKTMWETGEDVMAWWIGEDTNQLTFDDAEIYDIMSDIV